MQKAIKRKIYLRRVDIQVSLLTVCAVVLSSLLIFSFGYFITYQDMLNSLTERVGSIYSFLSQELRLSSFTEINSREDMQKSCYTDIKAVFKEVKLATGVQYLYTAKRAADGTLVYVIDGLDQSAPDFRFPGDPIEEEIVEALNRALAGEPVLPKDIKHTSWGDIFITYLPIYDTTGNVMGAIGIEFAAGHQYQTYRLLRLSVPFVILLACVISAVFALVFFRRISNPHFQDLANTDWLTGLKNRNAYELDQRNLYARSAATGTGLLLADLNGLKLTNDQQGHDAGDRYIKMMAEALRMAQTGHEVLYRVGGDEFVILITNASEVEIAGYIARLADAFAQVRTSALPHASYAIGWAICQSNRQTAFELAYREADSAMYEKKKDYYNTL